MAELSKKECIPCKGGIPPMDGEKAKEMLNLVHNDWNLVESHHIERVWTFTNFENALELVNAAGKICEEQNHHADFELGWGRVKAMIWTHKINGLTESDFILAAKFDEI
tara:strand:- start:730 stop:1056 length:327 start_codon:yes stop_codon:yes gene_type:complete